MDSLCHPWVTTTNLSYRFPILETFATALCGTTGSSNVNPRVVTWLFQNALQLLYCTNLSCISQQLSVAASEALALRCIGMVTMTPFRSCGLFGIIQRFHAILMQTVILMKVISTTITMPMIAICYEDRYPCDGENNGDYYSCCYYSYYCRCYS